MKSLISQNHCNTCTGACRYIADTQYTFTGQLFENRYTT